MWKDKGQFNPKVTLELYICNFVIWEKSQNFSSHSFSWLVNDSRLFSSLYLVLRVVRCGSICWFYFILVIAICGLFSYGLSNVDHVERNMCCELFPSACQLNMIVKLMIRCLWAQENWCFGKFELFHFA